MLEFLLQTYVNLSLFNTSSLKLLIFYFIP